MNSRESDSFLHPRKTVLMYLRTLSTNSTYQQKMLKNWGGQSSEWPKISRLTNCLEKTRWIEVSVVQMNWLKKKLTESKMKLPTSICFPLKWADSSRRQRAQTRLHSEWPIQLPPIPILSKKLFHLPNPRSTFTLHKSNLFRFTTEYMGKFLHRGQKTKLIFIPPLIRVPQTLVLKQ